MTLPLAATTLDQIHTTYFILALIGGLAAAGGALQALGFVGWASAAVARTIRFGVRCGFRVWERTLAWAGWPGFLALAGLIFAASLLGIDRGFPYAAVPAAALLIAAGAATCLAYMHVSVERYEVGRGFKALHSPDKGQRLAVDLIRHGPDLGIAALGTAAAATALSFALLNLAICRSGGRGWYVFRDPAAEPGFLDFLAYTFVNLLRAVDVFDLAQSHEFLSVSLIRPVGPPAYLLIAFKSFFTVVLLQQVFASLRQGWLLAETVSDFWSPHVPVRERAKSVLPQFGPDAVAPILVALRSAATLTQEQRDQLPAILAGIGPSAIPALLRHLGDRHETSRAVTAGALGLLKVREAVPHLARLATDPSEGVRLSAVEALGRIGEAHASAGAGATAGGARRVRWWTRSARWVRSSRGRTPSAARGDELALAVEILRGALRDASPAVRGRAAAAAGRIGPAAAGAAGPLLDALRVDADDVRIHAVAALGRIRPAEGGAVAALTEALADPTQEIRISAAKALGEYREGAGEAVSALVALLRDASEDVRAAAAAAISRIGVPDAESAESLVEGLASSDNVVRAQTAESLGLIGEAAETAAPALAEALADPNDRVRAKAAEALGRIGEAAAPAAIPALVRLLRDEDNWVRALAAEALGEMGPAAEAAAPALLRSLRHANPHVRGNAAESLGKLGTEAARTHLEAACSDPDAGVRAKAVRAVARVGALAPTTRGALLAAAADPAPEVRSAAADGIAEWAAEWPEAAEGIAALVGDGNTDVAVRALLALHKFADYPAAAIDAVLIRLHDASDTWIQSVAAQTLSRMGPTALRAGSDLARVALTGDVELRHAAMRALVLLQPEEALPAFLGGLRDADAEVRKMAAAGLQKAGRVPDDGLDAVVEALRDPDIRVRTTIASVLGRLDPVPPSAIPGLTENAAAGDDGLRLAVAVALRAAGSAAPAAVLEDLLRDATLRVRLAAASAVLANNPDHPEAQNAVREALADANPRIRELGLALVEPLGAEVSPFAGDLEAARGAETDGAILERIERLLTAPPQSVEPAAAG